MTQEFHISVTPVGQDGYLVRTEQVESGVPLAEELLTWPVADWLAQARYLMDDPLQSLWQGNAITKNSVNLVALGQQLYNALFQGTLRDSWITAQGIAQNQQQVLRLRLGLKDPNLARLPWEVMHAGDRPLATGPYVAFSRYQTGTTGVKTLSSTKMPILPHDGVRVLMVISSPTDLAGLDLLKQESIKLKAELRHRFQHNAQSGEHFPEIQLTLLEQPGREDLTTALEQGRYDVLHYAGHSNLGPNGGEIYLVNSRNGLTEPLSGDDLAGLLVNNGIQMAVFNSCLGAYPATSNPHTDTGERNLTESLVKRGITGVLAMAERIPDEVALTLTQLLYRNLSYGYPVDLCVSRVRQGLISAYGSQQLYWALPILYLYREFDGYLSPEMRLYPNEELLSVDEPQLVSPANIDSQVVNNPQVAFGEDLDDPGSLDDIGFGDPWEDDFIDSLPSDYHDPSYDDDAAVVSDIFQTINKQQPTTQPTQPRHSSERKQTPHQAGSQAAGTPGIGSSTTALTSPTSQTSAAITAAPATHSVGLFQVNLWAILGAVGISAMTLLGTSLWWFQQRQVASTPEFPPIPSATTSPLSSSNSTPIDLTKVDVNKTDTKTVTAIAIESFNKGDLQTGLKAMEALLNRNALNEAKEALAAVPNPKIDAPEVSFLRGRLAWQFVQNNKKDFSIDDARRAWETAVKGNTKSASYYNALGFAYYAEGKLERANGAWLQALYIAMERENQKTATGNTPLSKTGNLNQDALTASAGLALGMNKLAPSQSSDKRERLLSSSRQQRQTVLANDPVNFQPNNLAKNWLWTEQAIKDWQALLKQKG